MIDCIEPAAAGGHVAVSAESCEEGVRIRIPDGGVGLDPETARHGIAIANVRERLRATFGDRARLTLSVTSGGGVSAELRIPSGAADARAERAGRNHPLRSLSSAIREARRDLRGRYRLTLKDRPEVLRVSAAYGHLFRRM